jgi:hypothetical protein
MTTDAEKPMSADDLIKQGIRDRSDEEGLFAVAWALTKLNDTLGMHFSNMTLWHSNDTYTAKTQADGVSSLASSASELLNGLRNGGIQMNTTIRKS